MKTIVLSQHALEQMPDRGTTREEVEAAIHAGERVPAKEGRIAFRKNFTCSLVNFLCSCSIYPSFFQRDIHY
jgi:hypothetical protein